MAQKNPILKAILCGGGLLAAAAGIFFLFLNRDPGPGTADGPSAPTTDQSPDNPADAPGTFKPPTPANDAAHPDAVDADTALELLMAAARENAARIEPLLEEVRRTAATDPEATLAWALTLEGTESAAVLNELFTIWTRNDPKVAFAAAAAMEPSPLRDRAMNQVLLDWGARDPTAAWEATQTVQPSPGRTMVELNIATMFARRDLSNGAAALGLRAQSGDNIDALLPAYTAVAKAYATENTADAMTWLDGLPDGPAREGAVIGLVTAWAQTDPDAAGTWLNNYPAGRARDQGAAALAFMAEPTDPLAAMAWATSIADSTIRIPVTQSTASRWLTREPEIATDWIRNSSGLAQSEIQTIFDRQRKVDELMGNAGK